MKVVAYVSGHGFGHAVREAELARELCARGHEVVFVSNADPEAFWPLPAGARLVAADIDVGVLQPSSLEVDERGTLTAFERFAGEWPRRAAEEAERLAELAPDVVIADIAPLGVLAARRAGLPAVVVANFSWDWIYRSWSDRDPRAERLAAACTAAYLEADLLLELPLCGGLEHFPRRERVPLLARRARRARDEVRAALGVESGQLAVLVAFGGFGPPDLAPPRGLDPGRVRAFGYTDLGWPDPLYRRVERREFEHPDLVGAADLLIGKPGYGTVAECSLHGTRMLWLGRSRFPEVEVLEQGIRDHVGGAELERAAFAEGRLMAAIELALATPPRLGPLPGGGAAVIAERLCTLAGRGAA